MIRRASARLLKNDGFACMEIAGDDGIALLRIAEWVEKLSFVVVIVIERCRKRKGVAGNEAKARRQTPDRQPTINSQENLKVLPGLFF